MAATRVLRFGAGYVLEPAAFEHKKLAEEWTAWDPDHAGQVDPRFWLEQDETRDSYVASDARGAVLFFKVIIRTKRAELHMQFMPQTVQEDYERVRAMLLAGCPWLEEILAAAGVEEITFDSRSSALIAFATKRLGFIEGAGTLCKRVAARVEGN